MLRKGFPLKLRLGSYKRLMVFQISVLWLLIIFCYLPGFKAPFLLDDYHVILERAEVRGIKPLTNLIHTDPSRVLVFLSFALDYKLFQLNSFGYHFQNLIAHLISALLFYLLLRQILGQAQNSVQTVSWGAFFSALIFGIHPINTEAVTYLCGRFSLFVGMFLLLSLLAFEQSLSKEPPGKLWLIISYLAFVFSLLSKEEGFVVPVLLFAWLWCRGGTKKAHWLFLIPFGLLFLFGLLYRYLCLNRLGTGTLPYPRLVYLATEALVITKYLSQFLFPIHLSYLPEVAPVKTISPKLIFCLALLILLLFSTLRVKSQALRSFGILWMFIALAPSSSIIPLEDFMALHRFYNASLGALIALFAIFFPMINSSSKSRKNLGTFLLFLLVVFFSALTIRRNLIFAKEITLYKDALRHSPKSAGLLNDLGYAYYRKADYERARYYLTRSLARKPDNFNALNNMGITAMALGKDDLALEYFYQAAGRTGRLGKIYTNIGMIWLKKGESGTALIWLQEAVRRDPSLGEAHFGLGLALAEMGKYEPALQEILSGIKLSAPKAEMYFELGRVFLKAGKISSAQKSFIYALKLNPYFTPAQIALQEIQPWLKGQEDKPKSK